MKRGFVIAIDGPVASGKGTISPKLASKLDGFYLYSGAIYRGLALFCLENNLSIDNEEQIVQNLDRVHLEFDDKIVLLNGVDVTEKIKSPEVAKASSPVASYAGVREYFQNLQRAIAQKEIENGRVVVAEGRDMGTVIFPNAEFKLYLTATPEVRSERRLAQYHEKGQDLSLDEVLKDTNERDARDMNRETAPLVKNPKEHGYIVLDNSNLTEQETLDAIMDELKKEKLILVKPE